MTNNFDEPQNLPTVIVENYTKEQEFFTINSQKASEILGVNKTRLSQLTSQGIFPYERRKVESRSRLFYRLNDLLNYQRKSTFGNLPNQTNTVEVKALVPLLAKGASEEKVDTSERSSNKRTSFVKKVNLYKKHPLKKALDIKNSTEAQIKNENSHQTIANLEKIINKMMSIISNIECKLETLIKYQCNKKKSAFRRPRAKKIIKLIK